MKLVKKNWHLLLLLLAPLLIAGVSLLLIPASADGNPSNAENPACGTGDLTEYTPSGMDYDEMMNQTSDREGTSIPCGQTMEVPNTSMGVPMPRHQIKSIIPIEEQ